MPDWDGPTVNYFGSRGDFPFDYFYDADIVFPETVQGILLSQAINEDSRIKSEHFFFYFDFGLDYHRIY